MTQAQTGLALLEATGVAAIAAATSDPVLSAATGAHTNPAVVAFVFVGAFVAKLLPHNLLEQIIALVGDAVGSAQTVSGDTPPPAAPPKPTAAAASAPASK